MINSEIQLLDENTIDKIAAGEVIDRPASVIKELVENSIDANATSISIEIKDGGTSFIRISDNGVGIKKDQIKKAFLRHSTSKIKNSIDLFTVKSLGFRGEALSSIAAVSKVNVITKYKDDILGTSYVIEGGIEKSNDDIGSPNGTTFIVKDLFFNTPVRKKFLNSNEKEAIYIREIVEKLSLSRPDISFRFINQGKEKLVTSGNNNLIEVIYRIYGKNISKNILPIKYSSNEINVEGFIGKSIINRGNRKFEVFFVNNRSVYSKKLSNAVEEGYKGYLMKHQYPFFVLNIYFPPGVVDVNFHPKKEEVRLFDEHNIYSKISKAVHERLIQREDIYLINDLKNNNLEKAEKKPLENEIIGNEPFFINKKSIIENSFTNIVNDNEVVDVSSYVNHNISLNDLDFTPNDKILSVKNDLILNEDNAFNDSKKDNENDYNKLKKDNYNYYDKENKDDIFRYKQRNFLTSYAKKFFNIIGSVFDTYWIIEYDKKMYLIDQHAAHEKVNFERLMLEFKNKKILSQNISPPIMITLDTKEEMIIKKYSSHIEELGFNIEHFGGKDYAITTIPYGLFKADKKELFYDIINNYEKVKDITDSVVTRKIIATMACKASIKGNQKIERIEMERLLDELLTLENPYHCPHGRPTMIAFSRDELDKMFKRIV